MRMKYPKVSVVISTHNRPAMLVEAVQSVLDQTYGDYEIIVVDDGSHTAREALEGLAQEAKVRGIRFALLDRDECSGYQSVPKNDGIMAARGSYVAFLDDDNLWHEHHLQVLLDEIELEGADMAYGRWVNANPEGKPGMPEDGSEFPFTPFNYLTKNLLLAGPMTNFIDTSSMLWSKAALVGWLGSRPWNQDIRRFGDWDLVARAASAGLVFKGVDAVTFTYRWGHGQMQTDRPAVEQDIAILTAARAKKEPKWDPAEVGL